MNNENKQINTNETPETEPVAKESVCCEKKAKSAKKTSIGGQALLEGIMMRGPKKTSMAVRNTSGEIVLETKENDASRAPAFWKLPVFRGMYNMVITFALGYKCLLRSAELSGLDALEEEEKAEKERKKQEKKAKRKQKNASADSQAQPIAPKEADAEEIKEEISEEEIARAEEKEEEEKAQERAKEKEKQKKKDSALLAGAAVVGSVLGVVLAVVLFFWLPSFLFELIFRDTFAAQTYANQLIRSLFEGILKIIIFVGYMAAVTLMPDIRRTFMYHGAEHKTIFCYEHGLPLTVENVRIQRRFHPRCGTSFLIIMLILGILVGSVIPSFAFGSKILNTLLRTAIRLCLLPLVVGIGYELIKYAGRHDNIVTKIFSAPGLWMQRISTKEPDDSMIECAIAAMNEVIPEDDSDKW